MIKLVSYTLLLLLLLAAPSQAALIFHQDWEDGGLGSSSEGFRPEPNQACCDHSLTNVTSRSSSGSHSIRSLIYRDDPDVDGGRPRAEWAVESNNAVINGKSVLPEDQDRWFGFSIYISSDPDLNWEHIFNTHAHNWGDTGCSPSGASSPISLYIVGPRHTWSTPYTYNWRLGTYPADTNGATGERLAYIDATDDLDHWTNFVFHFNLSRQKGGPGLLEVWKNGVLVYQNLDFDISQYPVPKYCGNFFPKIGISTTHTRYHDMDHYIDSHRWGDENSSFAEVDPAQSSSPPPSPDPPPDSEIAIEAESGELSGTMEIFLDSSTSGGSYTRIDGSGLGIAEFTVNAETAGLYNIKGRVYAWSENNDTLLVSVDGGQDELWKLNIDLQKWTTVTYPKIFELSKGTHTIRFSEEDHSARLDYFTIENIQQQLISTPSGFQIVQ